MKHFFLNKLNFKENSKTRIFLFCLLVSGIMWFLITISKDYRAEINIIVSYQNPPSGKVLFNGENDTIQVELLASGGNLLKYRFRNPTIEINLDEVLLTNNNTDFWLPNRSLTILREKLEVKEVLRVKEDTVRLVIDILGKRKVPILSRVKVESISGLQVMKEEWSQDSVEINGPLYLVKRVKSIPTEEITFKNKSETFNQEVKLQYPSNIKGVEKIEYQVELEKYTEKTVTVKVLPLNISSQSSIKIFPEEVKLKFTVGYSDYAKVKSEDFKIICDLNYINDTLSDLPLTISKQPKEVENIRVIPPKVKILLIRK